jgi:hypothetical protein
MAVLDQSELKAIYDDMLARMEMGLITNEDGEVDADTFGNSLREAILEKMPSEKSDKHRKVDVFSVAFGAISERIMREYLDRDWW